MKMTQARIGGLVGVSLLVVLLGTCVVTYNRLVKLDQAAQAQWAQVDNTYQRRADLVPNLVETVRGAANFESATMIAVTQARSRVGQIASSAELPAKAGEFQQYQEAQDQLGGALSRLLVVAERYPQLGATQNFRDLQAQLEGSENRIAVERMRFNEAAREFNTARETFPASVVANVFGGRFTAKQYFAARSGAAEPPRVRF